MTRGWFIRLTIALGALLLLPTLVHAGMPGPLVMNDIARMRFETLSFFLVVLLVSVGLVRALWNGLTTTFTRMPQLSYGKALGLTILWGLLFIVVLAMISGARELMTPGAWEKHGATYRLKEGGK